MNQLFRTVTVFLLWLACSIHAFALQADQSGLIKLTTEHKSEKFGHLVSVLIDENNESELHTIRGLHSSEFSPPIDASLNYGVSDAAFWIKFSLQLADSFPKDGQEYYIRVQNVFLDKIDFYAYNGDQSIVEYQTGDTRSFATRPVADNYFVFPVAVVKDKPTDILIRAYGSGTVSIPLSIWEPTEFHKSNRNMALILGGYYGILIVMILYNLFVWISTRHEAYSYYLLFTLSMLLLQSSLRGHGFEFLWTDNYYWQMRTVSYTVALINIFSAFFTRSFLETHKYAPKMDKALQIITWIFIVYLPLPHFLSAFWATNIALILALVQCGLAISTGFVTSFAGNPIAKYFNLAWGFVLFGAVATILSALRVIPLNAYTSHLFLAGSAIEVVLFSLALAHRFSQVQKTAKRTLRIANAELHRSNLIKDQFLAAISHELRTPMNGVQGALSLLKETKDQKEFDHYMQIADRSSEHMVHLIDTVLNYSESTSGKIILNNSEFQLPQLLDFCIEEFSIQCKEKRIAFHPDLNATGDYQLTGDKQKIRLIVYQLLSNSVKFTRKGSIELSASVTEDSPYPLQITVADTGIGIAPDQLERIFKGQKSSQAEFHKQTQGIGIGLALCKGFVELMNGLFELESHPDQGTKITIKLPLKVHRSKASVETVNQSAIQNSTNTLPQQNPKILIVEDNKVNQMILKGMLEKLGYEQSIAENGKLALDQLEQNKFDLILMDLQMPIMDGLEASRHIRASDRDYKNIPIIAVTANAMSTDEDKCIAAGMNGYLKKPVQKSLLAEMIMQHLPTHSIHKTG